MSARYTATFDSLRPTRGVVVDEEGGRFAYYPTPERAQLAAVKLNSGELTLMGPKLADVLIWRSTETGELIDSSSDSRTTEG